jgi:hypothetical protein
LVGGEIEVGKTLLRNDVLARGFDEIGRLTARRRRA